MKTVLCYGDSNTYGYNPENGLRYPGDIRWTGRLQILLGKDFHVVEEGCNGRTTVFTDPVEGWKNGLSYLRPCLNTHKPVDVVILMLGTNDLKKIYQAAPEQIAAGAATLVDVIQEFTLEKQKYVPKILLVSPPEIGANIGNSPFSGSFQEDAVPRSRALSPLFHRVAEDKHCIFFDAASVIEPSREDSVHLSADSHAILSRAFFRVIRQMDL